MVRTRRNLSPERPPVQDARVPPDPLQLILECLEQQQKTIEDMRAAQARQEQERDVAIAAAVAAALANLERRQPEEEVFAANPIAKAHPEGPMAKSAVTAVVLKKLKEQTKRG